MNRTPPVAVLADENAGISPALLAVIATLARTYDAQRIRLLERAPGTPAAPAVTESPLRPLSELDPAVVLDGSPVSASIVDAVVQAAELAGTGLAVPLPQTPADLVAATAGWWDALLGDVERRIGLAPRSITVTLPSDAADEVKAVFADRLAA